MYYDCVKKQMRYGDGKKFKMGFLNWDFIGQGTASLTTIAAVVKQAEGDMYIYKILYNFVFEDHWEIE